MSIFCRRNRLVALFALPLFLTALSAPSNFAQQVGTSPSPAPPSGKFYAIGVQPPRPDFHEDWNNLSLSTSKLDPIEPLLGATDSPKDGKFVRQLYQVGWRPDDNIDLYIVRPKGVKNPPVVLYLYDFPQDTQRFQNDRWCELVTQSGFAAVGFVSALTGQRFHDRPMKQWFVSEMKESLVTTVHDVQMILDYLETRRDLDMNRVGMYGSGSGGTIAILAAAVDPRIKVLDVLSPWGAWPEWLAATSKLQPEEREKFLKPEFLATITPLDPVLWLPKVKTQRMRIQNIRASSEVPAEAQVKIEAAAPDTASIYQYGDGLALIKVSSSGGFLDWVQKQFKAGNDEKVVADREKNTHFYPALGKKMPDPNQPVERVN
jgi:hypothetical protein